MKEGKGGREDERDMVHPDLDVQDYAVVVCGACVYLGIPDCFHLYRTQVNEEKREEKGGNGTLYAESKNTEVSFRMAALLNAGVRALRCLCAT